MEESLLEAVSKNVKGHRVSCWGLVHFAGNVLTCGTMDGLHLSFAIIMTPDLSRTHSLLGLGPHPQVMDPTKRGQHEPRFPLLGNWMIRTQNNYRSSPGGGLSGCTSLEECWAEVGPQALTSSK